MITIDIAYAQTAKIQHYISININAGFSVGDVLVMPEVLAKIDLPKPITSVGIFGKKVSLDYQLTDGDRLEIYRPLTLSPMQLRRQKLKATHKG